MTLHFTISENLKRLLLFNFAFLAILDAYVIYGLGGIGLILLNASKIFNFIFIIYLLQQRNLTLWNWVPAILIIPFCWMYLFEESLAVGFMKSFARLSPGITLFLLYEKDRSWVIRIFIIFFYYSLIPALLVYPFSVAGITLPGFTMLHPIDGRPYHVNLGVAFQLLKSPLRLVALYDEPGVVGTFSLLILFFFYPTLSKSQKIVFALAGVLSWSLFFLVMIIPVLTYQFWREGKHKRVFFICGISFVLGVSLATYAASVITNKEERGFMYRMLIKRLKYDSDGNIIGLVDNRDNNFKFTNTIYADFENEAEANYYLGNKFYGSGANFGALSQRVFIFNYGYLLYLYVFLFFAVILPKKHIYRYLIALCILALSFYQRPQLFRLEYIMIIYGGSVLVVPSVKGKAREIELK